MKISIRRLLAATLLLPMLPTAVPASSEPPRLRLGIIGLDTSHAVAFTRTLNEGPKDPALAPHFAGVRVVAAYPPGSRDIVSSTRRVPEYTASVTAMGVEIVASIEALLERVDAVLLESNDGRVHYEQVLPVLRARKPVFVDKPLAGSLADVIRILDAAREAGVPLFCSSALRFSASTQAVARGSIGRVRRAETHSPATIEPTHPDLYWYGIHGCETLFTVLGADCRSVRRGTTADGRIEVTGTWDGGRIGIFREENGADRKGYGGRAYGEKGEAPVGGYEGYDPLLVAIVQHVRSGVAPVSAEEMTALYAFMEAADESRRRGGAEVRLEEVLAAARRSLRAPD
jgi:hypothetical protein